jgi:hypothetical protein
MHIMRIRLLSQQLGFSLLLMLECSGSIHRKQLLSMLDEWDKYDLYSLHGKLLHDEWNLHNLLIVKNVLLFLLF